MGISGRFCVICVLYNHRRTRQTRLGRNSNDWRKCIKQHLGKRGNPFMQRIGSGSGSPRNSSQLKTPTSNVFNMHLGANTLNKSSNFIALNFWWFCTNAMYKNRTLMKRCTVLSFSLMVFCDYELPSNVIILEKDCRFHCYLPVLDESHILSVCMLCGGIVLFLIYRHNGM